MLVIEGNRFIYQVVVTTKMKFSFFKLLLVEQFAAVVVVLVSNLH